MKTYKIIKLSYEPPEIFEIRKKWIIDKNPQNDKELHFWVNESMYLLNKLLYKCEY